MTTIAPSTSDAPEAPGTRLADRVFANLIAMFGSQKVSTMWRDAESPQAVRIVWEAELRRHDVLAIRDALQHLASAGAAWPPTLPEFVALIRDARRPESAAPPAAIGYSSTRPDGWVPPRPPDMTAIRPGSTAWAHRIVNDLVAGSVGHYAPATVATALAVLRERREALNVDLGGRGFIGHGPNRQAGDAIIAELERDGLWPQHVGEHGESA